MSDFRRKLLAVAATGQELVRIVRVTESSTVEIPSYCKYMDLFIVGGGGGGGAHSTSNGRCGCGGNGGEVRYIPGVTTTASYIVVEIGAGGAPGVVKRHDGRAGGSSSCTISGTLYAALGGSGGLDMNTIYDGCPDAYNWQTEYFPMMQPNGNLGGFGAVWGGEGSPGQDGTLCPFLVDGNKYGASGAGGSDCYNIWPGKVSGGETGGGHGGYGADNSTTNTGSDATFYGGGGGGGGFNSNHETGNGGAGYQGFVAIAFHC